MHLIEFLQDGTIQTAFVFEEQVGKLRILLPNRRELNLQENRALPWKGPQVKNVDTKDEMVKILNTHIEKRKKILEEINTLDIWEMTQGEVEKADLHWLTELLFSEPDVDTLAAVARALIEDKVHFRFSPPLFEIFPSTIVEAKKEAEAQQKQRERFVEGGMLWFKTLWDCRQNNKALPPCPLDEDVQERIKSLLFICMADKDFVNRDDEILWRNIIKAIPENAFNPLFLAMTWKLVPEHYNYWLDRADYEVSSNWYEPYKDEVVKSIEEAQNDIAPLLEVPFVSIDGITTKDIDDAFYLEKLDTGWKLTFALACPAASWSFGSAFDKVIRERGTSLYLPEATYHMLPESLGTKEFSLLEKEIRPAFVVECLLDADANLLSCEPKRARVKLQNNLTYTHVEDIINGEIQEESDQNEMLKQAYILAEKLLAKRISNNAVIFDKPEPYLTVEWKDNLPDYYENVEVKLELMDYTPKAQLLVSEYMVLVNSAVAEWATEKEIPLLYRTQDIVIPKEYAGIWSRPEDIARIARSLSSASLETQARPHAGMGLTAYAPITSPLRRYADLVNEAQILSYCEKGKALFSKEGLQAVLLTLNASLESVVQVQRNRPRYWKLLYCKQRSRKAMEEGNDYIWNGVITEENDHFISVALPYEQLFLRAKRAIFPDGIQIGQEVLVRLGKINPLKNEIQIVGVEEI